MAVGYCEPKQGEAKLQLPWTLASLCNRPPLCRKKGLVKEPARAAAERALYDPSSTAAALLELRHCCPSTLPATEINPQPLR